MKMGGQNSKQRRLSEAGDGGKLPRTTSIEPRDSTSSASTAYVRGADQAGATAIPATPQPRNSISDAGALAGGPTGPIPAANLSTSLGRSAPSNAAQGLSPLSTSVGAVGGAPAMSIASPGADGANAAGATTMPAGPSGVRANDINLDEVVQRLLNVRNTKASKTLVVKNSEIMWICHRAREIFLDQPVLLELNPHPSLTICGDIHGRGSL